jgi:hypothetical protein
MGTGTGRPGNGCGIGIPEALGGGGSDFPAGSDRPGNPFGKVGCVVVLGFSGADRCRGVNG